jgi:hypothetical protein
LIGRHAFLVSFCPEFFSSERTAKVGRDAASQASAKPRSLPGRLYMHTVFIRIHHLEGTDMTDKQIAAHSGEGNTEKDPADWVTGDEPMTGAQKSYLKTLSEEAKVDFDESLTKAAASKRIDELQALTGRGQ